MKLFRAVQIHRLCFAAEAKRYRPLFSLSLTFSMAVLLGIVLLAPGHVQAQQTVATVLQKNASAFNTSGTVPTSLTFNGTVTWTAGSTQESGTVQFTSSADGSAKEIWTLPTQSRSIVHTALTGGRTCTFTDAVGKSASFADSNCSRVIPWFSSWMAGSLLTSTLTIANSATKPADSSAGFERLIFSPALNLVASSDAPSLLARFAQAATVSVLYNAASGLATAMEYEQSVDSEPSHSLQMLVIFGDYRSESGYMVPHHIQRYVQRTLQSDITITSVTAE